LKLKFQTVAEKTATNFRGLLYFAAPGRSLKICELRQSANYSCNKIRGSQTYMTTAGLLHQRYTRRTDSIRWHYPPMLWR